jgi:carboxymethylenebutenolidase
MVEMWERHMAAEFKTKDIDATMATMTSDPFVNHVPVMTGGVGYNEVRYFYSTYFIPCQPQDTDFMPVARTIGKDRIVDELIHKFTHTIEMPWMLPGVRPTGKRVEITVVVVVQFQRWKDRWGAYLLGPCFCACPDRVNRCGEVARNGDRRFPQSHRCLTGTI